LRIARALFIASYRIPHACLSLQFDRYLKNIDHTYIFTNTEPVYVDGCLRAHGIDTTNFEYIADSQMDHLYPTLRNWWFDNDYRGSWLYQQALKLAAIDFIDSDIVLIQDPDTFAIKPYDCLEQEQLKFFILPNETHTAGYYDVLKNSLGIERQTPHCFVSEFMPVFKQDWTRLKATLEARNNCDAFDAIINNVPYERYDGLKWFSEYEFLGNWTMTQRPVKLLQQKRFQYKTLDQLKDVTREYNCVCDAIPKLENSLVLDPATHKVVDFEKYFGYVKHLL